MKRLDYENMFKEAKKDPEYWATGIMTDFAKALEDRINSMGLTRKEFAEKAGVKPSYLTRVMLANTNITALTMAKLAMASGGEVGLFIKDIGEKSSTYLPKYMGIEDDASQPVYTAIFANVSNIHEISSSSVANDELFRDSRLELVG